MTDFGGGRLFAMVLLGGGLVMFASTSAVNYLAANVQTPTVAAAQPRPVKQSIAGLKSVLDPLTTGSVPKNISQIVLDPCTGARKN